MAEPDSTEPRGKSDTREPFEGSGGFFQKIFDFCILSRDLERLLT